jgi:hypothetical protein
MSSGLVEASKLSLRQTLPERAIDHSLGDRKPVGKTHIYHRCDVS